MTNTASTPKTYNEIYVTIGKNGKPRYSYFSTRQLRLFVISAADAEASILAGAKVFRKVAGKSIFEDGGVEEIVG